MAVKKKSKYPLVRIRLIKSPIGRTKAQRAVIAGLGLKRLQAEVVREKNPEILGMIRKVDFMLDVKEEQK